jgi:hypothetical protein
MKSNRLGRLAVAAKARNDFKRVDMMQKCMMLSLANRMFIVSVQGYAQHETLALVCANSSLTLRQRINGWPDEDVLGWVQQQIETVYA